ncbi:TPA: hypothetical protein QDZ34_001504 [Stenotrophomonas maltophilia]|uniref:hypothetical protein n=1 Tax=Stenotrophomonas sp. TaxID=69392 RepID=UPI0028B245E2|nr:hypothetical protein [Stenotrophomonas sp.]HDS0949038.1 hypothetical protein [Stenotrophomonas maltophilia]HDS1025297.1 hypothetical protein [Stenotrophomonas maltophilia]HDS1029550.1 hypothetical protein [Stenotrophomonas maltophilia]HDS1034168.1 hypothetical protein [Stenotrophomonas maltophilia]
MLLSLLLALAPATTTGAHDEVQLASDGRILLLRTIDWDTPDGKRTRLTVHWQLLDDGSLLYEFQQQPAAAQEAHRKFCATQGMNVFLGSAWLSGEGATHAFHCSSSP